MICTDVIIRGMVNTIVLGGHVMLFQDFARWVLLAFGLLVVAALAVLAGKFGWLGQGFEDQLEGVLSAAVAFYNLHKEAIDLALWLIGVGGSVATAALTVHRSWYYAEINLPRRLLALGQGRILAHKNARPVLLASVSDIVAPNHFLAPIIYNRHLSAVLSAGGFRRSHFEARALARSIDVLKQNIVVVRARQEELEAQAITSHLIQGAKLSAEAASCADGGPDRRRMNEDALQQFVAALDVKADDVDALEFAAKQSLVMGDEAPALGYLQRMASAARAQKLPLRSARALRLQAEVLEKRTHPDYWNEARGILITVIDEVLAEIKRSSDEKTLELAKAYRVRGEVQIKREKFSAARTALEKALKLFSELGEAGREGAESTEAAFKRLNDAEKDREGTGAE